MKLEDFYHIRLEKGDAKDKYIFIELSGKTIYYNFSWIGQIPQDEEFRYGVVLQALNNVQTHFERTGQVPKSVDVSRSASGLRVYIRSELEKNAA